MKRILPLGRPLNADCYQPFKKGARIINFYKIESAEVIMSLYFSFFYYLFLANSFSTFPRVCPKQTLGSGGNFYFICEKREIKKKIVIFREIDKARFRGEF